MSDARSSEQQPGQDDHAEPTNQVEPDQSRADQPGADQPGADQPAADQPGANQAGAGPAEGDQAVERRGTATEQPRVSSAAGDPPGPSEPPGPGTARPRPPWGVVLGVLLACLAVLLVSGSLWWQYRQFYIALHEADVETARALERVNAAVDTLDQRLAGVDAALADSRRFTEQLATRIDTLPERLTDLESRLDAMQGGSLDARGRWLRMEAEHYLGLANTELQLAGNWQNAMRALELADDRLRQLANPAYSPVRERIAAELLALRSVDLPDIDGVVLTLGRLSARIEQLPMHAGQPTVLPRESATLDETEPGFGRLWLGFREALGGIFSVERRDAPVQRALSAEERVLVRRQLAVSLEVAKLAAVRRQPESYRESLRTAADVLEQDFDRDAAAIRSAAATLAEMAEVDVAPSPPDITGSLELMRRLVAGDR